ncbi:uncharacterized protein [Montipora capricornis]|uniref:uncharacterized protein n=1 Tax=Montipora foliosa TaxID=591990 RepID=UPI0035F20D9E
MDWRVVNIFIVFFVLVLSPGEALNNTNETTTTLASTVVSISLNSTASTVANVTSTDNADRHFKLFNDNSGLLQRSLYVAIAISAVVAIYFIVRAVKTKGRRKAKKYGVIQGTGETEFQPLDAAEEEEDEDMTLYDKKTARWPK